MDSPRTCPFCGGRALRKRPALAGAKVSAALAGTGASLEAPRSAPYLHCNGCTFDFVRADRDVKTIAAGLHVDPRVAHQIRHYHGEGVTVSDLLDRSVIGMARRVHRLRSLVSVSVARDELLVCFLHGGIRTFGSFVKSDGGPGGTTRYTFRGLSRA